MRNLIIATIMSMTLVLTGCVYATHSRVVYTEPVYTNQGTVYYEGVEYYYEPTPVYIAGVASIGLYSVDWYGHRHYRYVPHDRWHPHEFHHVQHGQHKS